MYSSKYHIRVRLVGGKYDDNTISARFPQTLTIAVNPFSIPIVIYMYIIYKYHMASSLSALSSAGLEYNEREAIVIFYFTVLHDSRNTPLRTDSIGLANVPRKHENETSCRAADDRTISVFNKSHDNNIRRDCNIINNSSGKSFVV